MKLAELYAFAARLVKGAPLLAALSLIPQGAPAATPDDAKDIFKKMTDYIAAQKTISASYDSDIEVVTTEGQKIAFASSGQILMQRPDKLRATRTGGYADVEMVFDGKTLDILSKDQNRYAEIDAPGTLGQMVGRIRDNTEAALPGADLFSASAYDDMTRDVTSAIHVGQGVIDGVECEHLAFRSPDADWQLWVQTGPDPVPRKYVITSKNVPSAPEYTLAFKQWRTDVPLDAASFAFTPPPGATKVAAASLKQTDEVPAGVAAARNDSGVAAAGRK